MSDGLDAFSPPTAAWFGRSFPQGPTEVQRRGWPEIVSGRNALLIAPTGSGKTLAAFLAGIDRVLGLPPDAERGTRVLYVSPLKALVYDVERNLRGPLVGILREAELRSDDGIDVRPARVSVRTGDTSAADRQRQLRQPGEILVTTPESLFLLLGSRARENLRTVHTVIVDEIHAIAGSKRGAHLALSLERLSELTGEEPQRIGLSATVRPACEVARFLGGDRPVEVVDASAEPKLDIKVHVPVADMEEVPVPKAATEEGGPLLGELYERTLGLQQQEQGIWAALFPALLAQILESQSTIVFVNSRGLCERIAQRINDLADLELVRAHHGSVSHEKRTEMEEALKAGQLRGIIATSSLELGIDMGAVDRVLLVESPGSVARGLQRVGRAGHQVGETSIGRIYPKFRGDLLESAVVASRMEQGAIESIQIPQNALDVLAQQVVALIVDRPRTPEQILSIVRRAAPFSDLTSGLLESVLDMLSGRYPSNDFADLRPLVSWDRAKNELAPRRGAASVTHLNAGTIPDRGLFGVFHSADNRRVGELDEEMVFETRPGDNILLGATTWRVEDITRDRVVVTPAPGEPGRLPFWRGDGPGRPLELGRALGAFVRELGEQSAGDVFDWVQSQSPLDDLATRNLIEYLREQREHTGVLPSDRMIVIERFRDELGDWRVCILSPFGARLHAPWAMAIQHSLSTLGGLEAQVMYTDDGIVLRLADGEDLPDAQLLVPDPEGVEEQVTEQLADTPLFAGLFRENASRALLMPRRRAQGRTPLWAQRLKAQNLLAAVRKFPSFPIVLETYRHALRDVFDVPGLEEVLRLIRSRKIRLHEVETATASPFSRSLVFAYVAAYIYEQDAPLAERRAQALALDRELLRELLGQAELRELLDADVLVEIESELQMTAPNRRARDADELHDAFRRIGDLSLSEVEARTTDDPAPWLEQLQRSRRMIVIFIAGEERYVAAEDAGLYRDALGAMPPSGLPDSFTAAVASPLEELLKRYARRRGPFVTESVAQRYALRSVVLEPVCRALVNEGAWVHGELDPRGTELDWCDAEFLRQLKRRTLAKLRGEVAPVDSATLARFLPAWQGHESAGDKRRSRGLERLQGSQRLQEAMAQLEAMPISYRALVDEVLPARVPGFTEEWLDLLAANGSICWIGHGPLGTRDGRIVLFRREHVGRLGREFCAEANEGSDLDSKKRDSGESVTSPDSVGYPPSTAAHADYLLEQLEQRGASFTYDLEFALGDKFPGLRSEEFNGALWDLVWRGLITNDTFGPLRSLGWNLKRRRSTTAGVGGRWSATRTLWSTEDNPTQRLLLRAQLLLERYGIVSREAVAAESIPGGFSPLYTILKSMEETGKVRRGYFVEGLSGAQFASPGAIDRLRAARAEDDDAWTGAVTTGAITAGAAEAVVLSTIDPAQPYGALLPWPDPIQAAGRPRRATGTWVVTVRGELVAFVGTRGRHVITFVSDDRLDRGVGALAEFFRHARKRLRIEKIDGVSVRESALKDRWIDQGFELGYRGMVAES